jgi:hypothetical protein
VKESFYRVLSGGVEQVNQMTLRHSRQWDGCWLAMELWKHSMVLTEAEQAFKELKNDLNIRPVYHRKDDRFFFGAAVF